jgi:hypothetical protein
MDEPCVQQKQILSGFRSGEMTTAAQVSPVVFHVKPRERDLRQ